MDLVKWAERLRLDGEFVRRPRHMLGDGTLEQHEPLRLSQGAIDFLQRLQAQVRVRVPTQFSVRVPAARLDSMAPW
jgi:hypothetical protein